MFDFPLVWNRFLPYFDSLDELGVGDQLSSVQLEDTWCRASIFERAKFARMFCRV